MGCTQTKPQLPQSTHTSNQGSQLRASNTRESQEGVVPTVVRRPSSSGRRPSGISVNASPAISRRSLGISPMISSQRGSRKLFAFETFDFEAAGDSCGDSREILHALAVGIAAGIPKDLIPPERLTELLSPINEATEKGDALRQETYVELIVPSSLSSVSLEQLETCVAAIGPSKSLTILIPRASYDGLNFLLIKTTTWMDDELLSSTTRSTALILLGSVVSNWTSIQLPPSKTIDFVCSKLQRNIFETEQEEIQEYLDIFSLTVKKGWNRPDRIWGQLVQENRLKDIELSFKLMIIAISFSYDTFIRNEMIENNRFVEFVLEGMRHTSVEKIQGRSNTVVNKLAFDLLTKVMNPPKSEAFSIFISLYQLLDDASVHLIEDPFKKLDILLSTQPTTTGVTNWQYNAEWTSILLRRTFNDDDSDVVKLILGRVLMFPFDPLLHENLPEWFLLECIIPSLDMDELYSATMMEASGAFKIQPTSFTTGKFKKIQERNEAKTELNGFDLGEGLYRFFKRSSSQSWKNIFIAIRNLKTISGTLAAVESASRVLQEDECFKVDPSLFQILTEIVQQHAPNGIFVKRATMLIGCILALVIRKGDCRQILKMCHYVPDFLLKHDTSVLIFQRQTFLQVFGATNILKDDVLATLLTSPHEAALLQAARCEQIDVPNFNNEEEKLRFAQFAIRAIQIGGPYAFSSITKNDLCSLCVETISQQINDPLSDSFLEEAWIRGGFSRATSREKMDSIGYSSLVLLKLLAPTQPFLNDVHVNNQQNDVQNFFPSPKLMEDIRAVTSCCLKLFLEGNNFIRPLVALSSLLRFVQLDSSSMEKLAMRLCSLKEDIEFVIPSNKTASQSTLFAEFQERKWIVLNLIKSNLPKESQLMIRQGVKEQLKQSENSSNVLTALMESLGEDSDFDFEMLLEFAVESKSTQVQESFITTVFSEHHLKYSVPSIKLVLQKMLCPDHGERKSSQYEALVKKFAGHVFRKTSLWSSNPDLCNGLEEEFLLILLRKDKLIDVVDFTAKLTSKTVYIIREEVFACRAQSVIHPSSAVRFACLNWLDELKPCSFIHNLAMFTLNKFLEIQTSIKKDKRVVNDGSYGRNMSTAILILSKAFDRQDCLKVTNALTSLFLQGNLMADTKQNLEMVMTRCVISNYQECLPVVVDSLKNSNLNGFTVMSFLSCASLAWHRLIGEDQDLKEMDHVYLDNKMLDLALRWIICPKSSIRVLAINICLNIKLRGRIEISQELQTMLSFTMENIQMSRLMARITKDQKTTSELERKLDLMSLFQTYEFNLLGDLCPRDLRIDRIGDLVRAEHLEFFAGLAIDEDDDEGNAVKEQVHSELATTNFFQKKIDTSIDSLGSARQSLVVVASAVDKIPNLAGLARTCEVFKARTLVLDDISVVKEPEFKGISRTAENWLPIVEVKLDSLSDYLIKLRREEGFMLVGLEQTISSIPLQDMEWPAHGKVCIILGAEGTGVPPAILALLDHTIEIPQFGYVKSLNVHVSGALCVWGYTQSMLNFGQT